MKVRILVCCLALFCLFGCSSGFTDQDVANAEKSIKTEFEKKDFTVSEVKLIKESDRKLSGFVRLKKRVPIVGDMEVTKNCTATMGENSSEYIWKCE